jgi:hypothetical protein
MFRDSQAHVTTNEATEKSIAQFHPAVNQALPMAALIC